MLQKSFGYAIKKDSTEFQKKSSFSRKLKLQNLSNELEQRLFYQKLFLIQYFDSLYKVSERNWVSTLLSSEIYGLSIGQGSALSPMENYQVFL